MFKPAYLCWVASALAIAAGCSANSSNKTGIGDDDDGSGNGPSRGGTSGAGRGGGGLGQGGGIFVDKCGNGALDDGEQCDDANKMSGDGCSAPACQLEGSAVCPAPGQPCEPAKICGDGFVGPTDGCDDGNTNSGDGCTTDCAAVEPGWQCRIPGRPCTPLCGDGVQTGTEQCDDANAMNGDGCSSTCVVEPGSSCTMAAAGAPSMCTKSVCGNGMMEAGESCDLGMLNGLFNGNATGCSKTCTMEPDCRPGGTTQACAAVCGDGNVDATAVPPEQCDDGNAIGSDGCSPACQLEPGFMCSDVASPDTTACSVGTGQCLELPITFRDFDGQNGTMGHPDFYFLGAGNRCVPNASGRPPEMNEGCWASDSTPLCKGIAADTLGPDGKPVLGPTKMCACRFTDWDNTGLLQGAAGVTTCTAGAANPQRMETMVPVVTSADTFKEWYADSTKSQKVVSTIQLAGVGTDFQFSSSEGRTVYTDLHDIFMGVTIPAVNGAGANTLSSGFFPLEMQTGIGATKLCNLWPYWTVGTGACVANDGNNVPQQWDPQGSYTAMTAGTGGPVKPVTGVSRNFYFTSEIRYLFRYGGSGSLAFYGDDDVWVYINGRLALDLGAPHERLQGTVTMNGAMGSWTILTTDTTGAVVPPAAGGTGMVDLGLEMGKTYEIVVYHADRHPRESNYQLTLSGFPTTKTTCQPRCGDAVATAAEECDCGDGSFPAPEGCIGANSDDSYGGCSSDCHYGPYCGDGVTNGPEQCDNGGMNGILTVRPVPCTTACVIAPYCGDGEVNNVGEQCDPPNGGDCDQACIKVSK